MAIAEGNALGKGPVVFELPPSGIALVRGRAAAGDPVFMQLEVRVDCWGSSHTDLCAPSGASCRGASMAASSCVAAASSY